MPMNTAESQPSADTPWPLFRPPTVADIPGLLSGGEGPAPAPRQVEPDYAAARSMLDFLDRMSERLRPGAQQFIHGLLPDIRETFRAMHVELDRLEADLDEVRCALQRLADGAAPARAPGDGAVHLGQVPSADEPLDEDAVDRAYEGIRTLNERLANMGSERLVEAIETIELGFLALENARRERGRELTEARTRLAEAWAHRPPGLTGPDEAPRAPVAEELSQFGLSQEQIAFFEDNGYVGPITLCSPHETARIRRWIDRTAFMHRASPVYASGSPRGSAEARDWHLIYREIYELCTHPALVGAMQSLLGPDLLLWRSQFMRKEAGAAALAWHQDGSFPGGKMLPALNPVKTVSSWLAIDAARVDNGCVWVVPGSHKGELEYERREASRGQGLFHRGFEVQYAIPQEQAVPMVLAPGQFMLFDCQTLHGSSHNPSPWRRLGLAARYTSTDVRVYEGQDVDGQGYALDRFGCVLVSGEDAYQHNTMALAPMTT